MRDDGTGSASNVISGLNAAVVQARVTGRPSVISMSLQFPPSPSIDNAVCFSLLTNNTSRTLTCVPQVSGAIGQGIPVIVGAGNNQQDANNFSPSRVVGAITVGATTIDDTFASFSNFGEKIDILAPGQDILSASNLDDHANDTLSGTSVAV